MPAYFIALRESPLRDPDGLKDYFREFSKLPRPEGMRPITAYAEVTPLHGAAPDGAVVLEFPDVAAAQAWYNSPEYQAVVGLRLQAADYRDFIVDGLKPRQA